MIQHFDAADGTRLAFRDEGEGPAELALAGLSRDGRDFDYMAEHLSGIRLIRLDSRGRGASDRAAPETYTIARETADALALLDHLGLDPGRRHRQFARRADRSSSWRPPPATV